MATKCVFKLGRKSAHGFTLIELLVVISIIALLIALLLPALAAARQDGLSTVCLSNLRELGQGYIEYSDVNRGEIMPYAWPFPFYGTTGADAWQYNEGWTRLIAPYLTSDHIPYLPGTTELSEPPAVKAIMTCPVTNNSGKIPGSWGPGSSTYAWRQWNADGNDPQGGWICSYGMNGWVYYPEHGEGLYSYTTLNLGGYHSGYDVQSYFWPKADVNGSVPLFGDCAWVDGFPLWTNAVPGNLNGNDMSNVQGTVLPSAPGMMEQFCINRHNMAINMAFCDGHAEHVPLGKLWQLRWTPNWQPKNVVINGP
jgi:prepilin-type N-terminal cleavage/methylation domain-containing protein/prepilin-type processing-associated H-X9-DG protein